MLADFAVVPALAGAAIYAAFAALLLAAASRWVRPIRPATALVLALLPLAFTGEALLTGRVLAPLDLYYDRPPLSGLAEELGMDAFHSDRRYDVAMQMMPWRRATRYALAHGEWPVWNPFMLSGDVLAASAQPAAYHPVHLASYLLPLGAGFTFSVTAAFLWAIVAAFLFAREVGCRDAAAAVAGAAWGFCNFNLIWSGWVIVLGAAVLPFLFLATRRVARRPGVAAAALLAVGLTLVVLAGHPETTLHVVTVAAVWGALELAVAFRRHRDRRRLGASVTCALAAGAVALALSAVDLLPFVDAMQQSREHQARRNLEGGIDPSVPWAESLRRLRGEVVPYAYGLPWGDRPTRQGFRGSQWTGYVGSVLWGVMVYGLWRGRWRGRWALLALLLAGWSFHVSAPGLSDLLTHMPVYELAIHRRLVFVAGVASALLAGLGVEAVLAEPGGRRRLAWTVLVTTAVLGLGILLLEPGLRADGRAAEELAAGRLRELVPPFVLGLVLLAVPYRRVLVPAMLALLLAQRVWQYGRLDRPWPAAAMTPEVPQLAALAAAEEPGRVIGRGMALAPNLATYWELEDPRGYNAIHHARLARTYSLWVNRRFRGFHNARVDDLEKPFLDFLNVRWAVVPDGRRRVPQGWRLADRGDGFAILENQQALPRAFVPRRVRLVADARTTLDEMAAVRDYAGLAWIERPFSGGPRVVANGEGEVASRRHPRGLDLVADLASPAWVVISQTAWDGWRATGEDGRELPLAIANHAFLALHLDAGEHRVALRFAPTSFVVGRALTLGTLGVLLVFGVWRRRGAGRVADDG